MPRLRPVHDLGAEEAEGGVMPEPITLGKLRELTKELGDEVPVYVYVEDVGSFPALSLTKCWEKDPDVTSSVMLSHMEDPV